MKQASASQAPREMVLRGEFTTVKRMKVTHSCPTLCNLMDYTVHGLPQARILEFPSPGGLLKPGIKPRSPGLQADLYQLSHSQL